MTNQSALHERNKNSTRRRRNPLGLMRTNGKGPQVPLLVNEVPPEFASAFGLLGQNLEHLASKGGQKVILVVGAYPGDGRTTIVANLGIALAKNKHRVVLVDADTRNPSLAAAFQHERRFNGTQRKNYNNGVSLKKVRGTSLYVLTPQSTEKLTAGSLLQSLRDSFDFILIDSKPYPGEVDVFRLAALSDGVVYAIRSRAQDLKMLREFKEQLELLGVDLLGAIYSDV